MSHHTTNAEPFIKKVDLELKRAERYSVFVSVLLFDLSTFLDAKGQPEVDVAEAVYRQIHGQIRAIDDAAILEGDKLALLFPETDRQGAEIAARRLVDAIKTKLEELNKSFEKIITPEMASYPDAAGTRTIKDFLMEYSRQHMN